MPETHLKSQPTMPKSSPKSLKVPTFIQSIRSTFSLRRSIGCSSASTAVRMSANWRPRTQLNTTTTNNKNINSKKNTNFIMSKKLTNKVVVVAAARSCRRHHQPSQQQFVDLESPPVTPNSPPASDDSSLDSAFFSRNKQSFSDRGQVVAKDTLSTHTENPVMANRATSPVTTVALDFDSVFRIPRPGTEVFRTSQQRRAPHSSPEEISMRQTNILMGRSDLHDQFRDWRLDTDDMTYEQLLTLGDKIGYVTTGLKDSDIQRYVKKIMFSGKASESEPKCSICQDEYEPKDTLGLLKCTHSYHRDCIKQWLKHKKICPVCKCEVTAWS